MIFLIFTALIGGALLYLLWNLHHKLTYWQRQGIPTPGLLYQWHYYRRELGPYDLELFKKLGPIYGTYQGTTPTLMVHDPDLIREILVKDFTTFPNHRPMKSGLPIIDLSLFSIDGNDDWKRLRSIVSPTFTSGKLRLMDSTVHDAIDGLKVHFRKAVKEETPVNVRKYFNALSFDAIVRYAYGVKVDIISDPTNPISKNLENLFSGGWEFMVAMFAPKVASFFKLDEKIMKPFKFFEDLSEKLIKERKASSGGPPKNDFVQLMLDANKTAEDEAKSDPTSGAVENEISKKTISEVEMMAQSLIFLLAGFETTATIMACCAYHLALNPDVQEKLIAEVSALKTVNHDTVMELKYLEAVLKECFRLTPPVIRVERESVVKTKIGNAVVLPNTIVSIPTYAVHRDPKQFNNPEVFDPNRFLEGGADVNHHPYAFLPFGGGPRKCIAQRFALMEAKMALALVLKEFHFEPTPETKMAYAPCSLDGLAPLAIMLNVKSN